MGLWRRLTRGLEAFSNISPNEASVYGEKGEQRARKVLSRDDYHVFFNRIIPHPRKRNRFLETDAIVYAEGNVFCIEIKRYKGRIYFPKKKTSRGGGRSRAKAGGAYDESRIIKEKVGNYGEGVFRKEFPNPLKKTKYYLHNLKRFLSQVDERFSHLFIFPVVGFSDRVTDISAIHSMKKGLIYISEIPQFIHHHRNEKFARNPSQWIIDGLAQLPTWDRIKTRKNEWLYGIIKTKHFTGRKIDGQPYHLPFKQIQSIRVRRYGTFSDSDEVTVRQVDGTKEVFRSISGSVKLERFGKYQQHRLRNVNQVIVGTQAVR